MKKQFIYLATTACIAFASCANDDVVNVSRNEISENTPISFRMDKKNISRANAKLQSANHYNFGLFGYKSSDAVNNIMANYLVGYNGENKGYYMTSDNQTTLGDKEETVNGKSMWAYEKLGSADYTYDGTAGFYTKSQTAYMSNVENQYLRYWDKNAASTSFYAYAPYINGTGTATYDNSTKTLTVPDGSLVDGYDDASTYEYMYAAATVNKADYGNDVVLSFKRLNAKVNIKFWENIAGYSVRIIDLGNGNNDVQAAAAIKTVDADNNATYSAGEYFQKSGYSLNFTSDITNPAITQAAGTKATNARPLVFKEPTATEIGTTKEAASASPTTYYAIPKNNTTGFTFHVSYELTSTTGEKIIVRNATVFVPADKCNWKSNTAYTYVFKITKNSNGSTDPDDDSTIDPTSPDVDPDKALYPIVFDGVNVEDWLNDNSDYTISE